MSGCDVCIGVDSIDEPFEFSHSEMRTARKSHTCCECGKPIQPGSRYEHCIGKYDGQITSYDTCALCVEIRDVFTCGNSWYFGQLWEEMNDFGFEDLTTASPCFRELSPEAKKFTLAKWRKWKGLPHAD